MLNKPYFQFEVTATDKGTSPKNASNVAKVIVKVVRNTAPYFEYTPYSTVIPATLKGGQSVFQTTVRDNDQVVCIKQTEFAIIGVQINIFND